MLHLRTQGKAAVFKQEESIYQEIHPWTLLSWTSQLAELWEVNACYLSHAVYSILLKQPELTKTQCMLWEFGELPQPLHFWLLEQKRGISLQWTKYSNDYLQTYWEIFFFRHVFELGHHIKWDILCPECGEAEAIIFRERIKTQPHRAEQRQEVNPQS